MRWKKRPEAASPASPSRAKEARAVAAVRALTEHADFSWTNPNRVRSVLGAFAMANQVRFHQSDGAGYTFLGDCVLKLDALNPQITARLVSAFNQWRRFDEKRQLLQQKELERVAAKEGLSKDTGEIVGRALSS